MRIILASQQAELNYEEVKKFLKSISERAVLQPIVIKLDEIAVSGPKRRTAVLELFRQGVLRGDTVPRILIKKNDRLEEKRGDSLLQRVDNQDPQPVNSRGRGC
jgi:hypothetical protein